MEFQNQTDVGNRAAQHCGAPLMDAVLGFTEISKTARHISFCYGKLRRAELQRNLWTFATRRTALRAIDTNTMLLAAALWVASTAYFAGSIVSDQSGTLWISRIANNLGNQPQNSTTWEPYFGPVTVTLYDATLAYFSGELVYTAAGDGTNRVFLSLQSSNSDNPATATAWSATGIYSKNQVVTYLATAYMSLIDLNTNQVPSAAPALWSALTTYAAGTKVGGADGVIYQSIGSGNVNHDPTLDGGVNWTNTGVLNPWTTVFVGGAGSLKWLQIGGKEFPMGVGLTDPNIIYPIGSGPSSQTATRNVYRLPAGFLKKAPQDPKAGSFSWLGVPSNRLYEDWVIENGYIVTTQVDPIVFRFVADVQDVAGFEDMFCEGLAARIAREVCEPLTQSTAKHAQIDKAYEKAMFEARASNAIEAGPTEAPLDDYIACRA